MQKLVDYYEAARLLDGTESVYLLVHLAEGSDPVPIPISADEMREIIKEEHENWGNHQFYVSHDVEDESLYFGRE